RTKAKVPAAVSTVLFGVFLGGMVVVFARVQMMAMRNFRVVRGFLVIPCLVMLGRLAMVLCGLVVVVRGLFMMIVFRHFSRSRLCFCRNRKMAMTDDTFATGVALAMAVGLVAAGSHSTA